MKELQEIEDNLNELEKRGVELEVRLRKSEEGEINTHLLYELPLQSGQDVKKRPTWRKECIWD